MKTVFTILSVIVLAIAAFLVFPSCSMEREVVLVAAAPGQMKIQDLETGLIKDVYDSWAISAEPGDTVVISEWDKQPIGYRPYVIPENVPNGEPWVLVRNEVFGTLRWIPLDGGTAPGNKIRVDGQRYKVVVIRLLPQGYDQ